MANWSELPEELVHLFAKRLPCVEDFVQFGAVCKTWRSIAKNLKKQSSSFAPWMMLTKVNHEGTRSFYSYSRGEEEKKIFRLQLPQAQGRRCWGSPYGWLFTLGLDLNIHLLHPLSQIQISLPSQPTFPQLYNDLSNPPDDYPEFILRGFLKRFALSSNPSFWTTTTTCLVMAIFGGSRELALATHGNEAWTSLDCHGSEDVIFFNGQFYVVTTHGVLRICDTNSTPPKAIDIASPSDRIESTDTFYLIEISGDLHLVARTLDEFNYDTVHIQVFKFDFPSAKWSLLDDLGDHALFIGNNASFAISTTIYSDFKPNCIYYTDDNFTYYGMPFCDMGIFDYKTEETLEAFNFGNDALSMFSRPLFFMPSL